MSLLVFGLILILLFGGLGFLVEILWWGIAIGLGLVLAELIIGNLNRRSR